MKDPVSSPDPVAISQEAIRLALAEYRSVDLSWLPSIGSWSLAPDALKFIFSLVVALKPRHVLELGSGISTLVTAAACSSVGPEGRISSVDHDPEFLEMSERSLIAYPQLRERVRFQCAPLIARQIAGESLPVYHLNAAMFATQTPADLIVMDGPPDVLGGREGTLYQVLPFCAPGSVVLLDDSKRSRERSAVAHWEENLGDSILAQQFDEFTKGLAVIVVRGAVSSEQMEARRIFLTIEDLHRFVPANEKVIMVDEEFWRTTAFKAWKTLPFLERDGEFDGPPEDDADAIAGLVKSLSNGANFLAFLWPAFWWLDHYHGFADYLNSKFDRVLMNQRIVLYDLRQRRKGNGERSGLSV